MNLLHLITTEFAIKWVLIWLFAIAFAVSIIKILNWKENFESAFNLVDNDFFMIYLPIIIFIILYSLKFYELKKSLNHTRFDFYNGLGFVTYSFPNKVWVDKTYRIEFKIVKDTAKVSPLKLGSFFYDTTSYPLNSKLIGRKLKKTAKFEVEVLLEEMQGEHAFAIELLNMEKQVVNEHLPPTNWIWEIKALEEGKYNLYIKVKSNQKSEVYKCFIKVRNSLWSRITSSIDFKYIFITFLIPIYRRTKKIWENKNRAIKPKKKRKYSKQESLKS